MTTSRTIKLNPKADTLSPNDQDFVHPTWIIVDRNRCTRTSHTIDANSCIFIGWWRDHWAKHTNYAFTTETVSDALNHISKFIKKQIPLILITHKKTVLFWWLLRFFSPPLSSLSAVGLVFRVNTWLKSVSVCITCAVKNRRNSRKKSEIITLYHIRTPKGPTPNDRNGRNKNDNIQPTFVRSF